MEKRFGQPSLMSGLLLFFCILTFFVPFSTAWADPGEYGRQPVRLAFYDFGYLFEGGKGIDKDIVDELARRSGCVFETQVMKRARIWADLESGNLAMSVSGIQTPERDEFAFFIHYIVLKNYAVIHSSLAGRITGFADFFADPALNMGAVTSFVHGPEQDRQIGILRSLKRVQDSPDSTSLFMKLKDHRVDAVFSHPPVYRKYLSMLGMEKNVVVQDWAPGKKGVPAGLILSKKHFTEAQAEKWRKLILGMKNDGTLTKIYMKYVPEAEAKEMLFQ